MGLFCFENLSPWEDWLLDVLKKLCVGGWNSLGKFYGQSSLPKSFLCTKTWENVAESQLQRMWLSWDNQALGKSDAPGSAVPCCALEEWLTPEATHPFHPQPPVQKRTTVLWLPVILPFSAQVTVIHKKQYLGRCMGSHKLIYVCLTSKIPLHKYLI